MAVHGLVEYKVGSFGFVRTQTGKVKCWKP